MMNLGASPVESKVDGISPSQACQVVWFLQQAVIPVVYCTVRYNTVKLIPECDCSVDSFAHIQKAPTWDRIKRQYIYRSLLG